MNLNQSDETTAAQNDNLLQIVVVPHPSNHQGELAITKVSSESVPKNGEARVPIPVQYVGDCTCLLQILLRIGDNPSSFPQDNDIYKAKQKEALQKYKILVDLEKQLLTLIPGQNNEAA